MIDPMLLLAFLPAALALSLVPGPEMMFRLGRGLSDGPRTAALAALGMAVGGFSCVMLAGLGLSAVLERHPTSFDLIRWAGILYLLWIAVRTLRGPLPARSDGHAGFGRDGQALGGGYLVSVVNPKGAVFVLALLPQFMSDALPGLPQFLVLGSILVMSGLAVNVTVGIFAHCLHERVLASARAERALRIATAGLFGILATRLIAEGRG